MEINKRNCSNIRKKELVQHPNGKLIKERLLSDHQMNEGLISNSIYHFFFLPSTSAIVSDSKTAKMLLNTDQGSHTSMKNSGNTIFHICFANKSSAADLFFASASCCVAHLCPVFIIFQFIYIRSAISGSSQSTNVSQISPTLRWRCFATAPRTTSEGFTTLSSKKHISIWEKPSLSANGFHLP